MQLFKRSGVKIGGKNVPVSKITITKWRELFESVETLPQLLISVVAAPEDQRSAYLVLVLEKALNDVIRVTAVLTGLDEKFIEENAALDELVLFFVETLRVNNFGDLLKSVQTLLTVGSGSAEITGDVS